ncbi:MAG: sulfurtransferase TusE [Thermotogales bacterium]|nr:sulfurtransferase TusE [Thermotogales bacterium]
MMTTANKQFDRLLGTDEFTSDPDLWNEDIARAIARRDGFAGLTRDHWTIIHALREHYHRFGAAPPAFRHICNEHHLGKYCVESLFHSEREAWRIAGLPDPGEEAKSYML